MLSSRHGKLKQIQKKKVKQSTKNKTQAEQNTGLLNKKKKKKKEKVKRNYLGKVQRHKRNLGNSKGFEHR